MKTYRQDKDGRKILQCHSRGDTRFSPLFCYVDAFSVNDTIENHYQKSKLFMINGEWTYASNWKEAKLLEKSNVPRNREVFRLPNGLDVPIEFQVYGWYSGLWLKYLDRNPELCKMASGYDDYEDIFKHSFPLCQADCIRLYCKQGRNALMETCSEFFRWVKENG